MAQAPSGLGVPGKRYLFAGVKGITFAAGEEVKITSTLTQIRYLK